MVIMGRCYNFGGGFTLDPAAEDLQSQDPLPQPVFTLITDHVDDVNNTGTHFNPTLRCLGLRALTIIYHLLYEHQRTQATEGRMITI